MIQRIDSEAEPMPQPTTREQDEIRRLYQTLIEKRGEIKEIRIRNARRGSAWQDESALERDVTKSAENLRTMHGRILTQLAHRKDFKKLWLVLWYTELALAEHELREPATAVD
ncbi:hypothetical protein EV182_002881, partial [Spiromyces aspiralis]